MLESKFRDFKHIIWANIRPNFLNRIVEIIKWNLNINEIRMSKLKNKNL